MISLCLSANGQGIQKDPKHRRELLLQFASLNTSHCYKSAGCQVFSCKIPSAVRYFKMISHTELFWKANATFSAVELPLTGLLENKVWLQTPIIIMSENIRAVQKALILKKEKTNKNHGILKALHRIHFSMFFISINIYLHIKAYLYKPQSIAGTSRNHRVFFHCLKEFIS